MAIADIAYKYMVDHDMTEISTLNNYDLSEIGMIVYPNYTNAPKYPYEMATDLNVHYAIMKALKHTKRGQELFDTKSMVVRGFNNAPCTLAIRRDKQNDEELNQ